MPSKSRPDTLDPMTSSEKIMQTLRMPRDLVTFLKSEATRGGRDFTGHVNRWLQGVRSDFGLPEARTLYLFPHAVFKIRPENDRVLARVLAGDPQGVLVLCAGETERMTRGLLDRLLPILRTHGVGADRVKVLPPLARAAYLELNQLCDVMLDAMHWSGGNTTLDAIAAGLPVVTRWGRFMRGRQSAGMLAALELDEWIAADEEEFVTLAAALGQDPARRRAISTRMQGARQRLFDRPEPVAALADWLEKLSGSSASGVA